MGFSMNKLLLSCIVFSAACGSFAQDLTKKVDFAPESLGAKPVLEGLSKLTGVHFSAGKAVENDPLYVRVSDTSIEDLMKRIAEATSAEWEKTSDGFRLVRSANLKGAQYQAYLRKRSDALKAGIANYVKENAKDGRWDVETVNKLVAAERKLREDILRQEGPLDDPKAQTMVSFSGSMGSSPATVALFAMIPKFSPRELAELPPNGRWVYSSDPTRMQRLFRFDITDPLNRFVAAHNLLADLVGNETNQNPNVHFSGGLDLNAKRIVGPIGKMLLIATRSGVDGSIGLKAKFFDGQGKLIDSAVTSVALAPEPEGAPTKFVTKPDPVALSAVSQEFKKLLGSLEAESGRRSRDNFAIAMMGPDGDVMEASSGASTQAMPISTALLQALQSPETHDPLSFAVKEVLDQTLDGDVVACLPDEAVLQTSQQNPPSLQGLRGIQIKQEANWTVISAADPYVAESNRANRAALGAFLRAGLSKGYADLTEMGALSLSLMDQFQEGGLVGRYVKLMLPETSVVLSKLMTDSRSMLSLYGTLSQDQRKLLESGQNLAVGTFDATQNGILSGLVYGAGGQRTFEGRGRSISMRQTSGDAPPEDPTERLSSEKTELLPNGVPSNSLLGMQFQPREAVFSKLPNARDGRFLTGGELGMQNAIADKLGSDIQANVSIPIYSKFKSATITRIPWTLMLGQNQLERGNLRTASVSPGNTELTLDQMPESFRKAVQAGIDAMKNVKINTMKFGDGPPPQR